MAPVNNPTNGMAVINAETMQIHGIVELETPTKHLVYIPVHTDELAFVVNANVELLTAQQQAFDMDQTSIMDLQANVDVLFTLVYALFGLVGVLTFALVGTCFRANHNANIKKYAPTNDIGMSNLNREDSISANNNI